MRLKAPKEEGPRLQEQHHSRKTTLLLMIPPYTQSQVRNTRVQLG